ncbi:MAG: aldehyde dehydrogenase, partial [Saprospiraceae bacterium]
MPKIILPAARWESLLAQLKNIAPEMFDGAGHILNHIAGDWQNSGHAKPYLSPVDGTELGYLPMLSSAEGKQAVQAAAGEFAAWRQLPAT